MTPILNEIKHTAGLLNVKMVMICYFQLCPFLDGSNVFPPIWLLLFLRMRIENPKKCSASFAVIFISLSSPAAALSAKCKVQQNCKVDKSNNTIILVFFWSSWTPPLLPTWHWPISLFHPRSAWLSVRYPDPSSLSSSFYLLLCGLEKKLFARTRPSRMWWWCETVRTYVRREGDPSALFVRSSASLAWESREEESCPKDFSYPEDSSPRPGWGRSTRRGGSSRDSGGDQRSWASPQVNFVFIVIKYYFLCGIVCCFSANFPEDVVDALPNDMTTGIYFGWAKVDEGPQVHKMVMSVGWNPYYKNEKKSMVREKHFVRTPCTKRTVRWKEGNSLFSG